MKSISFTQVWSQIVRSLPLILIVSLLLAAATYLVLSRQGVQYRVHYSYIVALQDREAPADFRFDGYYALQATDLFAQTLEAWVMTPEVIVQAYQAAQLPLLSSNARQLAGVVEAQKKAPQLVSVVVKGESQEQAERLSVGLRQVMDQKIADYHTHGIPAVSFRVMATDSWVGTQSIAVSLISLAVFIAAILVGINAVLVRAALRED